MFFLIRSALCIGVVAFMLPGAGTATVAALAEGSQAAATEGLRRYCDAADDCAATGARVAGWWLAGHARPAAAHDPDRHPGRSVTTLDAADLTPPWRGPAGHIRG